MIDKRCLQILLLVTSAGAAMYRYNDVGEVSRPHNLTCDVAQRTGSAKWLKEDSLISECTEAFTECATQKEFIGSYTASFVDKTATLIIANVTLQNEGRYSCIDVASNNILLAYFKVYARPENVSCHVPELQTDMLNVKVVCTVTRTYPSPTCQFSWLRNGTERSLTNPQVITYQNLSVQGQPGYFYQTCTLTHPVQDLGLGSHAFRVRAYPNVTGSPSDTKYGVDSDLTQSVTIDGPKNVTVKVNNLAAPGNIRLCDKSQPVTVNLTCTVSVDGVSPGADYEFIINGSRRPANPVGSSSLTYSVTAGGPLSVQCRGSNSVFKDEATSPEQHLQVIEPPSASPIIDKYQDSGSSVALTDGHLTVQEGINNRIRCRVEGGYPSVSSVSLDCGALTTTSEGNVAFLDVNVNRSRDARECSCTATHSSPCYMNNKTKVNLKVLFGPTVVSFTVNETEATEIVVEKDSELRLACDAEGNPSPSLALTKDGLQLEVYNGLPQKFNLSLKLNKTKTDCTDAGVYSCRAQTDQGVEDKSVDVNVRCPQQLQDPLLQHKVYLTKSNSSMNISVAVLGYPKPTLQLNSDHVLDSKAYRLNYTKQRPSYGVVSLQIYTVATSVFQNYSLSITNSLGTLVYSFQILEEARTSTSSSGAQEGTVWIIIQGFIIGCVATVAVVLVIVLLKRKGFLMKRRHGINDDSHTQTVSSGEQTGLCGNVLPELPIEVLSHSLHEEESSRNTCDGIADAPLSSQSEEFRVVSGNSQYEKVNYVSPDSQYDELKDVSRNLQYDELKDVSPDSHYDELKDVSRNSQYELLGDVSPNSHYEELRHFRQNSQYAELIDVRQNSQYAELIDVRQNSQYAELIDVRQNSQYAELIDFRQNSSQYAELIDFRQNSSQYAELIDVGHSSQHVEPRYSKSCAYKNSVYS